MKRPLLLLLPMIALAAALSVEPASSQAPSGRWSEQRAAEWYAAQPWLVGCNYAPSSAVNQLEMWQGDTFDAAGIDRELGWAHGLGFNSIRVFTHHLLWEKDREGFLRRMDRFLDLCRKHRITVMLVPFDAVWDPHPYAGRQRAPTPHLHNSGWVQSPGAEILRDPARHDEMKPYLQGLIRRYRNDPRIVVWDLFNEPDNINRPAYERFEPPNKPELARVFLEKCFRWAREVNPSQPLTSGVWLGDWTDPARLSPMERLQLGESDVITFHNYGPLDHVRLRVEALRRYRRPILCTEYMARPNGSRFDPILAYFKQEKVGAYNWGFVEGKSQTIYPWDSWTRRYTAEPPVWFHDIFRRDGTPYDPAEVQYIRSVTGARG